MEPAKLSIVTPCFNQEKFIEATIQSVLSQNWPNLEYIIIDGGSTDGTVDIIKKYEKHLSYWVSEPDRGQYFAINKGLARTTGEIMAWIGSDDIYHPNAFMVVMDVFKQMHDAEWIIGQRTGINEEGQLTWTDPGPMNFHRERFLAGHFDDPWIQQESVFWRRSLWNKAGGHLDTRWKLAADTALWAAFFRYSSLTSIGYPLAAFRKRQNQRSQLYFEDYMNEGRAIIAEENQKILSGAVTLKPDAPKAIELQIS